MNTTLTIMPWSRRGKVRGADIRLQPPNENQRFNDDLNRMGFMATLDADGNLSGDYKHRNGGRPTHVVVGELLEWIWAHRPNTHVNVRPVI